MDRPQQAAVVMDWGGTWIRTAVMDRAGETLWQARIANPKDPSRDAFLQTAYGQLTEAMTWRSDLELAGVGVAVAGPVDSNTGVLNAPPNLPALDGVSLKAIWEPLVDRPVWVDNDASLAALGEFQYGAGRDAAAAGSPPRTLVYVTVSTGIGGGVVHGGQVFQGATGLAVEIGHTTIDSDDSAPYCECGSRGCLEAFASGTAIARMARGALSGRGPLPASWPVKEVESITSKDTSQAAGQGDPVAVEIFDGVVQALSVGLTNAVHLFNPDLLVLGGGVTLGLTELGHISRLQELVQQRAMSDAHRKFRFVTSQLGDNAGMAGAAALVWNKLDG